MTSSSYVYVNVDRDGSRAPPGGFGGFGALGGARKPVQRRIVDFSAPVARWLQLRLLQGDSWEDQSLPPAPGSALDVRARRLRVSSPFRSPSFCVSQMLPPAAYPNTPATSFTTKFVHVSMNKARAAARRRHRSLLTPPASQVRAAVDVVAWTPEGRRLLTGSQIGEFTLWNGTSLARPRSQAPPLTPPTPGTSFNFETILQAHDSAIRSLTWSHNENWLISGACGRSPARAPSL